MPEVVVVGGGVAGLVAARDLAAAGLRVTVLEATDRWGGCVAPLEVAGLRLDAGAESFATRTSAVADLLVELGLGDAVVPPAGGGAWVQLPDGAVPLPRGGLLGIPASVRSAEVRRVVGLRGVLRGCLDRVLPARVGLGARRGRGARCWLGVQRGRGARHGSVPAGVSLGHLVRVRLGRRILDRLVAPVVTGVHSVHPDLLDLDAVLPTGPSLRDRLLRHGSLTGAVAALRPAGAVPGAAPGSAVAGLVGGMNRLVSALVEDLTDHGVTLRTDSPVIGLEVAGERCTVHCSDETELTADTVVLAVPNPHALLPNPDALPPTPDALPSAPPPPSELSVAERSRVRTTTDNSGGAGAPVNLSVAERSRVRTTTDNSGAAAGGAAGAAAAAAAAAGAGIVLVTLVLDAPELDGAPRGTGVLVAAGVPGVRAKALTHASAKWPWIAQAAGSGRHVVRLSYRVPAPPGSPALPDGAELRSLAVADAARLLSVPLDPRRVIGWARTDWPGGLPRPRPGERQPTGPHPSVHRTGASVAGTGLAAVVQHARATAAAAIEQLEPQQPTR